MLATANRMLAKKVFQYNLFRIKVTDKNLSGIKIDPCHMQIML